MARPNVLDTNRLIDLWRGKTLGIVRVTSAATAEAAARAWLAEFPEDVILTPVRLEFLGGTRSRDELRLAEQFLSYFRVLDDGRILTADWQAAERYVKRVPFDGRPRGLFDCLITAIADRLHAEIDSRDTGLPPRAG